MEEVLEAEKKLPEESQNKLKIQHLSILVDYINTDYAPIRKVQYPLIAHSEITFELLWSLFVPNTLLYTICEGSNEPRCLKLDLGMEKEDPQRGKYFSLDCRYVDYDGKTFGQARAFLEISDFVGTRRIDNLPVFPLAYHDDEESIRDKLIARGRKFGEMKGMHYKYYKGLAFVKKKRELVRVNVQSRIMVDPLTFRRINPNYSVSPVKPGGGVCSATGDPFDEEDSDIGEFGEHDETSIPGGTVVEGARIVQSTPALSALERTLSALEGRPGRGYKLSENRMRLVRTGWDGISPKPVAKSKESMVPEEMSEEELLICSPTVLGFSFGDKLWVEFAVEHIREIVFNTGAFDSLVLPENQKTIVRALVESQNGKTGDKRPGIGDIIQNKGKGMVAVLHGRPGVGKTLTAEGTFSDACISPPTR